MQVLFGTERVRRRFSLALDLSITWWKEEKKRAE